MVVILDITTSLDGFVAGANVAMDNPMGDGGEALHDWLFAKRNAVDEALIAEMRAGLGAVILGRRTFDIGEPHWEGEAPFPVPCFVLTHRAKETVTKKGIPIRFVTEGIHHALALAKRAAGDRAVLVMGGAETIGHFLKARLIEEISLHIAHVALGRGLPLFGPDAGPGLQKLRVVESDVVTHIRFRAA